MSHDWQDFNDAKTQSTPKEEASLSTQEIKSLLIGRLREVLHYLLPAGVIKTGKFHVGDIQGNASKDQVIAAVQALGHKPGDDNEADALALLHFAIEQHDWVRK